MYKEFKEFFSEGYPRWKIFLWYLLFLIFLGITFFVMKSLVSKQNPYPSTRYRKVVKEGLLWDSVEYHER